MLLSCVFWRETKHTKAMTQSNIVRLRIWKHLGTEADVLAIKYSWLDSVATLWETFSLNTDSIMYAQTQHNEAKIKIKLLWGIWLGAVCHTNV